jgi:2-(1,2-epoxy-1,2-dihydrophenyl)acetyl-CoA isomerase
MMDTAAPPYVAKIQEHDGLLIERDGPVGRITFNRPEKLNAIRHTMIQGIDQTVGEWGKDPSVRVIVITGSGRAFSSGDDIVGGMGDRPEGYVFEPTGMNTNLGPHHHMVKTIMSAPKPVVAALNGRTHGAGWVTALACDFRVARSDALIGDIRSGKAIFAGQTVPLVLPRLIGQSRAMDILITGRVFDAIEAERYGIVQRVWSPEEWDRELANFIDELASGPTITYAAWKLTVNRSVLNELDAYTDYERRLAAIAGASEDVKEGRDSFREKRAPKFQGR